MAPVADVVGAQTCLMAKVKHLGSGVDEIAMIMGVLGLTLF